ncbi:MAG TPA: GNAT family N-acetyltransferase [Acetobacteraceae bacterium]|nr:GNAT family N-acetyltransferase [Acetobacteraceae bacterium]
MSLPEIRLGLDSDAEGFIALIGACWSEYPGVVLDVDRELPELRALASYYEAKGGMLWVAADESARVVGMIATAPHTEAGAWEILRLYVARAYRGTGLAHRLVDLAEAHARAAGARRLRLWSDTRFRPAHRFYEKRSYVRTGPLRPLDDLSFTLEFGFAKPLAGISAEALAPAAAASAGRVLAALLPVSHGAAAHWRNVAADIAAGTRALVVAWDEGVIAASLELALSRSGLPRLEHSLLAPGRSAAEIVPVLLAATDLAARRLALSLLTAQAEEGTALASFLPEAGWRLAGRLPGSALFFRSLELE